MASGIDFNEDADMNSFSMRTLMGTPAMEVIAGYGVQEPPFTYRRYLSINTEILGQVIKNATGKGLGEYMEEKLWTRIGSAHDARFARLYLHEGNWNGEQLLPRDWIRDSLDISADYSKPGANNDGYNAIGYGYQWWVPEGDQGEFMAIGVYGQFLYVNPEQNVIIVKVNADPDFMAEHYELKHVEFFRAIADGLR